MAKIDLTGLDICIDKEVAQEFIQYRGAMEKKYHLKTQGQFDRQMKKALKAHEVGMSPTDLIEWTMDKNWVGINITYTATALSREMQAITEVAYRPDGGRVINQSAKTRDMPIQHQLTDNSWAN